MILHFDITSQPAQGDTPLCALGTHTGRQMASSAFWRTPQGQPELGLGFGRRNITDFFLLRLLTTENCRKKVLVDHFPTTEGQPAFCLALWHRVFPIIGYPVRRSQHIII